MWLGTVRFGWVRFGWVRFGSVGFGGRRKGTGGEGKVEWSGGMWLELGWVGEGPDVEGIEKAVLYREGGWKRLG